VIVESDDEPAGSATSEASPVLGPSAFSGTSLGRANAHPAALLLSAAHGHATVETTGVVSTEGNVGAASSPHPYAPAFALECAAADIAEPQTPQPQETFPQCLKIIVDTFDHAGKSPELQLAFDSLFDKAQQMPSEEDTEILPFLRPLTRNSRDALLALFGIYMPANGGGRLRRLFRCKTPLSWEVIKAGLLMFQTPCLTWRAEIKAAGQLEWVQCKCTRSEDPTAGEYSPLWVANSEMPPIVCNNKGVLVFMGSMMKKHNDRPIVNAANRAYTTPKLTHRLSDPVSWFSVARTKVCCPYLSQYSRSGIIT
jgi:hypothetical protein